jgi:formate dehydrogenase subunit delta
VRGPNIEKLVKMANQIAANSDYGPDKDKIAASIADHLTRFWTPAMRKAIIEGHRQHLVDLTPTAAHAVEKLVMPTSGF